MAYIFTKYDCEENNNNLTCFICYIFIMYEMILLLGVSRFVSALYFTLFINNVTRIPKYVMDGTLDLALLKPCNSQFYLSTRYLYLNGVFDIILSLILIICASINVNLSIEPVTFLISVLLILCGFMIGYSIWIMLIALSIRILHLDNISELFISVLNFTEYPSGIYTGVIHPLGQCHQPAPTGYGSFLGEIEIDNNIIQSKEISYFR
ncbi:ABC-2 family transporter protein [Abyssisolibacter fermentans]|uniref:ABC-2 family transporter protein n=1 Tax=Abyssisolibacter fermentans TaxID=1766203 RepID=UPI00082B2F01|nr:ABC-2 family transporter protein [Abyssisolibacter fermentans]